MRYNFVTALALALTALCIPAHAQTASKNLTNKAGTTLAQYAVVVADTSNTDAFTTTTTADAPRVVGVIGDTSVSNNALGIVIVNGIAKVQVTGSVSSGDFLGTSTTAGKAASNGSSPNGSFGWALEAGTDATVRCMLMPPQGSSPATALSLNDDIELVLGTDSDYRLDFDSGTSRLEVTDGTNILASVSDDGTTGTLRTAAVITTGDITAGNDVLIADDHVMTFGDGADWSWGYDSSLDAAVLVDAGSNILFRIEDLGATALPIFEATVLDVHRATSSTATEVAVRLGLNDTGGDALSAAEMRAQWTTNTLSAEVSRLGWYVRDTTLAEQMRLSGDGDLTVFGSSVTLDCDEAATSYIAVSGQAAQNRTVRFDTSNSRRWAIAVNGAESGSNAGSGLFFQAYDDSATAIDNALAIVRAANGLVKVNRPVKIDTITTTGDAAIEIKQDDADEPFIKYTGTSAASTANNITTFTSGATLAGYVRQSINGTDYWTPYYTAPTS